MVIRTDEMALLERKADEVASMLKALSNPRRLLLLCKLVEKGSLSVGQLEQEIGLSQSAVSQHLAIMREEGLVAFDRAGQTLHYRIADARLTELLGSLYRLYCANDGNEDHD